MTDAVGGKRPCFAALIGVGCGTAGGGRRAGLPAVAVRFYAARAGLAALVFGGEQLEARGGHRRESARAAEPGHHHQPVRHRAHSLRRAPLQQGDHEDKHSRRPARRRRRRALPF